MTIFGPNSADSEMDSGAVVQDTSPDTGLTVLELRTAARFLRTTPDALRKRIQRGKVDAYKEGGQWFVRVDTADRPDRKTSGLRGVGAPRGGATRARVPKVVKFRKLGTQAPRG